MRPKRNQGPQGVSKDPPAAPRTPQGNRKNDRKPKNERKYDRTNNNTENAETSVCVTYGALRPRQGLPKDTPGTPKESPNQTPRATKDPKVSPRIPQQPQGRPKDRPGSPRESTSTPEYVPRTPPGHIPQRTMRNAETSVCVTHGALGLPPSRP